MATRFYLTSSSSKNSIPFGTPNVDAAWQETSQLIRRAAKTQYDGTAAAFTSVTVTSTATTPELHVCAQYISDPIEAQTISGTITGQILCSESNANFNGTLAFGARVISDAGTVRGTLVAVTANTATTTPPEFATTLTNRTLTGASSSTIAISNVVAVAGDRIVLELGIRDVDAGTARTGSLNFGASSSGGDLPIDNTTTAQDAPWIEFSGTITFMSLRPPLYSTMLEQFSNNTIQASGMMPGAKSV